MSLWTLPDIFGHRGDGRSWHRSQARIAGSRRRRVKLTSDDAVSAAECAAPIRQFVSRDIGIPPPSSKNGQGLFAGIELCTVRDLDIVPLEKANVAPFSVNRHQHLEGKTLA